MGTQKRNYKHGDQKHLHRSIMAITSGPLLYIIIHIKSFFKKSLELNNVKKFIKLFLLLISYKINNIQNILHKLLEIS